MTRMITRPRTPWDALVQSRLGLTSWVLAAGFALAALFSLSDGPDETTMNAIVIGSLCVWSGFLFRRSAREFWEDHPRR